MRTLRLLGCGCVLLLIGVAASCSSLEDIELGVCGNGVLDPGEDCDGHEKNGAACGAPGAAGGCRYVCDFESEAPVCPDADYRCGATNICARAGDGLSLAADLEVGGESVVVSDLDGDRIADISVANGASRELVVSFLGAGAAIEAQQRVPVDSTVLAGGLLTSEDRGDLVVAPEGSLVSLSSQLDDRNLVGNASLFIELAPTRLVGVPARALLEVGDAELLEPDTVVGGVLLDNSVYYQNPFSLEFPTAGIIGAASVASEDVTGLFTARFFPLAPGAERCDEVVLVRSDTRVLTVVPMCVGGQPAGEWAACIEDEGCAHSLELSALPFGVFPLQLDDDPESEIVVLSGSDEAPTLRVFQGVIGEAEPPIELTPPNPFPVHIEELVPTAEQDWLGALAAAAGPGDETKLLRIALINEDADPDFVRSDGVYLSKRDPAAPGTSLAYFRAAEPSAGDGGWVEAVVGDFGGDERLDVLASYGRVGADLDLSIGNGLSYMNPLAIGTAGAAVKLTVGDFDGDGRSDVVFRERATNDQAPNPSCEEVDSLVVRFGAEGPAALGDVRVLARTSGIEDLVAGSLPRFDTNDSISDFATASRCVAEDDASEEGITLFYGAVNRQVVAPKVLLDDLDNNEEEQKGVPYTPKAVTAFPSAPVIAALGENRFEFVDGAKPTDFALFVLESEAGEPLKRQHMALMGEADHLGLSGEDFRIAVANVGGQTPLVVVADPKHIHLVPTWADLPKASDIDAGSALDAFSTIPIAEAEGLVINVVLAGDLTGDGVDDLVIGGTLDAKPFLRVHTDLAADPGSYEEVAIDSEAATAVTGAALLPRSAGPGEEGGGEPVDLVVAVAGVGGVVIRFDGAFAVHDTLAFSGVTAVGAGDVDGDQFADVVLVAPERARVFVRTQRYAGDEISTGEP